MEILKISLTPGSKQETFSIIINYPLSTRVYVQYSQSNYISHQFKYKKLTLQLSQSLHGADSLTLPDYMDNDTLRSTCLIGGVLFFCSDYRALTETTYQEQCYYK